MGLADKLEEARQNAKPTFEQWLAGLDKSDRTALEDAAGDTYLPTRKLITIVRAEGISVGEERFKDWRISHGFAG